MTSKDDLTLSDVTQEDLDLLRPENPSDVRRIQLGKRLAELVYLRGMTQTDAIMQLWPNMARKNAELNSTRIMRQYEVLDRLYEMIPPKIREDEFERMFNWLKERAFSRGDERLVLELLDRFAKANGRYKQELTVEVNRGERDILRLERARKILADKGLSFDDVTV